MNIQNKIFGKVYLIYNVDGKSPLVALKLQIAISIDYHVQTLQMYVVELCYNNWKVTNFRNAKEKPSHRQKSTIWI